MAILGLIYLYFSTREICFAEQIVDGKINLLQSCLSYDPHHITELFMLGCTPCKQIEARQELFSTYINKRFILNIAVYNIVPLGW